MAFEQVSRVLVKRDQSAEHSGACAIQCLIAIEDQDPALLCPGQGTIAGCRKVWLREIERYHSGSVASGNLDRCVRRSGIHNDDLGRKTAHRIKALRQVLFFVSYHHAEAERVSHAGDQSIVATRPMSSIEPGAVFFEMSRASTIKGTHPCAWIEIPLLCQLILGWITGNPELTTSGADDKVPNWSRKRRQHLRIYCFFWAAPPPVYPPNYV